MYVPFVQALSDPEQREIYDRSGEDGLQKHRGNNGGSDMFSRCVSALCMALSCHDNSTQHRVRIKQTKNRSARVMSGVHVTCNFNL